MRNPIVVASLDIETTSLQPKNGRVRCLQLAWDGGELFIDAFDDTIDVRKQLEVFMERGALVAFNAGFEHSWIKHHYHLDLDVVGSTHYRMATVGGRIYSREKILNSEQRVYSTGLFNYISLEVKNPIGKPEAPLKLDSAVVQYG